MNYRKTQNEKQRGAALLSARIAQNSSVRVLRVMSRKTQNEKQRGAALLSARIAQNSSALSAQSNVRSIWTPVNNIEYFPPNF